MNARFSISDFRSKIPVTAFHVRKSSFSWIAMNGGSSLLVKCIKFDSLRQCWFDTEFETYRFDMVWRFDICDNLIFKIGISLFPISVFRYRVQEPFWWKLSYNQTWQIVKIFLIQGFRLFDSSIDTVSTFEFGHDITILKMVYLDKVDQVEIEPALIHMLYFFTLLF